MSRLAGWAVRFLATAPQSTLHKLHTLRFRRLAGNLRGLAELCDDATGKLGGQWVLDRKYVASLGQRALDLGREMVFDSGVMAGGAWELSAELDSVRSRLDGLLARRPPDGPAQPLVVPLGRAEVPETAGELEGRLAALVRCALEAPGQQRGVLLTRHPDRPLSMRLEIGAGGGPAYVIPRHPSDDASDELPPGLAPLIGMALVVERLAGRPQRIAWARNGPDVAVAERADLDAPGWEPPSGPRLGEALRRSEVVFRDPASVAVAGFAAGRVRRVPEGPGPSAAERPPVIVLEGPEGEPPREALRGAAAVLVARELDEEPWLGRAREWCVPVLAGLGPVTERLVEGEALTVDAEEGIVYRGLVEDLVLYHLAEPSGHQSEPEYRLLREVIRQVAPPSAAGATLESAGPPGASPLARVLQRAHERALRSFDDLHFGPWGRRAGMVLRGSGFPGSIRVVDAGGGTSPAGDHGWRFGLAWDRILSEPLRVLLEPLTPPEGLPPQLPRERRPAALAVLTEERATVHVTWSAGSLLIEAGLGEHASANRVYCALRGTSIGDAASFREALIESGFRLLDLGPGVTGWVQGRGLEETSRVLEQVGRNLGRLVSGPARVSRGGNERRAGRGQPENKMAFRSVRSGGRRA